MTKLAVARKNSTTTATISCSKPTNAIIISTTSRKNLLNKSNSMFSIIVNKVNGIITIIIIGVSTISWCCAIMDIINTAPRHDYVFRVQASYNRIQMREG